MDSCLDKDLSAITDIPASTYQSIAKKASLCIGHSVYENIIEGETVTSVNIGIGTLFVGVEGSQIKYKFVPNRFLENAVSSAVKNEESPLIEDALKSVGEKFMASYRELL